MMNGWSDSMNGLLAAQNLAKRKANVKERVQSALEDVGVDASVAVRHCGSTTTETVIFCSEEQVTSVAGALANIGGYMRQQTCVDGEYKIYANVPTNKPEAGPFQEIPARRNWRYRKST